MYMLVTEYSHKKEDNVAVNPSMFNTLVSESPMKSEEKEDTKLCSFIMQT